VRQRCPEHVRLVNWPVEQEQSLPSEGLRHAREILHKEIPDKLVSPHYQVRIVQVNTESLTVSKALHCGVSKRGTVCQE